MDYCVCGRPAQGRCVGCQQPVCGACQGRVFAAKTAIADRLGLARSPVLCRPCEIRELDDLRVATGERVRAAIDAAEPLQARLLALGSHREAGASKPGPETAHWPTFEALKAGAGLVEGSAYREMLALVRAGKVMLATGQIRVFVDARVKHLTGVRIESDDLGQVPGRILEVQLTGSDWPVTVQVALRPDGALLKAPAWVSGDWYRVRLSRGKALDPFPIPMDKNPMKAVKAADMRQRLARLRAELDHIKRAAPGTNEFDTIVRQRQPEVDPQYAEHQMFLALWASVDAERTPVPKL